MTDQAKLEQLNRQLEAMFARMQSTEHAAAVDRLMDASEQEICAFLEAYYQSSQGMEILRKRS